MRFAFAGLLVLACLLVTPVQAQNNEKIIPDDALRGVVEKIVKKKTGKTEFTDAALGDIYFLRAADAGIADLTGLEKLTNLASVKLGGNKIKDLSPLKDLTDIQLLDLRDNNITDISPLSKLTKLQYLQLQNNHINDLKPIAGLTAMASLYLGHNEIADLSPVSKLTGLSSLYAGFNKIKDITPVATLKSLDTLDLQSNEIADLAPLTKLTELRLTLLQNNKIKDLAPLVKMALADSKGKKQFAPYWELYLAGNPLSETAKTKQIPALEKLGVAVHLQDKDKKEAAKG